MNVYRLFLTIQYVVKRKIKVPTHSTASENHSLQVWEKCWSDRSFVAASVGRTKEWSCKQSINSDYSYQAGASHLEPSWVHCVVSSFSLVLLARSANCLYLSFSALTQSSHHSGIIHPEKINLSTTDACCTSITSSLASSVRWLRRLEEEEVDRCQQAKEQFKKKKVSKWEK